VGDVLSQQDDKIFNAFEYVDLRREFIKLLDFTNLTFDEGLRSFLIDSNFRLPGESQKIERLLDMFSEGYCRDNPGVFTVASSREAPAAQAAFLSFAIMLLHTDAWNPNVAKKNDQGTIY
jgi:brefeldin A-inhibited guanine nucleotide-exchange protein